MADCPCATQKRHHSDEPRLPAVFSLLIYFTIDYIIGDVDRTVVGFWCEAKIKYIETEMCISWLDTHDFISRQYLRALNAQYTRGDAIFARQNALLKLEPSKNRFVKMKMVTLCEQT
jgi:hypothetical protein